MTEQQEHEMKMTELQYRRRIEFEELKHKHVMEELQFMAKHHVRMLDRGFKGVKGLSHD